MPANYHKYECRNRHITLLLIPVPYKPEAFKCPVCDKLVFYAEDILVKGLGQIAHGTHSAYAHGCRCDACREANRIHSQDYRDGIKTKSNTVTTYRDKAHQDLVNYMEQGT